MDDDEHDLPTPEEIADVTGGDVDKIRDGLVAFDEMDEEVPSVSENIGPDCGGCADIRPPLRDYTGCGWHWIEQSAGESEE